MPKRNTETPTHHGPSAEHNSNPQRNPKPRNAEHKLHSGTNDLGEAAAKTTRHHRLPDSTNENENTQTTDNGENPQAGKKKHGRTHNNNKGQAKR